MEWMGSFRNASGKNARQDYKKRAGKADPRRRRHILARAVTQTLEPRVLLSNSVLQVGGTISANAHWSGTVQVTSNLSVSPGVDVTVDPGTVIKSGQAVSISVAGTLDAQGTGAAPIIFTSTNDDSAGTSVSGTGTSNGVAGSWAQLSFNPGSYGSILNNVQVRFAGNASAPGDGNNFRTALAMTGSALHLSNVQVLNSDAEAVRVFSGAPVFNTVSVQQARQQAFEVDPSATPTYTAMSATNTGLNAIELDGGTISDKRTWDFGGLPVQVNGNMNIAAGGQVTVVPGQVVKFYHGQGLTVDGTLTAQGTAALPILFTSFEDDSAGGDSNANGPSSGVRGDWRGLVFDAGSDNSSLQNVQISYAGNASSPGDGNWFRPAVQVSASIQLQNVQVLHSDYEGIVTPAGSPTYTNVSVNDARSQAFETAFAATPVLAQLSASNTGLDGYELDGGTLAADRTWIFGGLVAQVKGNITVASGATLTVDSGQTIKFYHAQGLNINGALQAAGTSSQPITFTSYRDDSAGGDTNADGASSGVAGDWQAISFTNAAASTLQNVIVHYAGNANVPGDGNWFRPALQTTASNLTLSNVQVMDSDRVGVQINSGAANLNAVAVQNARSEAFIGDLNAAVSLANLSATGAHGDRYVVLGGTLAENQTWSFGGLVAQLSSSVTIPAGLTLTVVPGQIVKLSNGQVITANGTLNATGTADAPIIFTSQYDDSAGGDSNADGANTTPRSGDWQAINLLAGSDASVLKNAQIRYAGNANVPGDGNWFRNALLIDAASPTVQNVQITNSDYVGVRIQNGSDATLNGVAVSGSRNLPFSMDLASNPSLASLSETNNGVDAFFLDAGALVGSREWNITSMPYLLGASITVPQGLSLTVDPGAVVKLTNGQRFAIDGTFIANGTLTQPITFTSRADERYFGDTLRVGPTAGASGQWDNFVFTANSTASVLNHVDIDFAGNANAPGDGNWFRPAIDIESSSPSISNTRILNTDSVGVNLVNTSASLSQLTVNTARQTAFVMDLASTPTLSGLRAVNTGSNEFYLNAGTLPASRTWNFAGLPVQLSQGVTVPAFR